MSWPTHGLPIYRWFAEDCLGHSSIGIERAMAVGAFAGRSAHTDVSAAGMWPSDLRPARTANARVWSIGGQNPNVTLGVIHAGRSILSSEFSCSDAFGTHGRPL